MSLEDFLKNKPLYYAEIDYTRMPLVYEKIKTHFKDTKIIHLIGTNGKGTTGRFLATALCNGGFKVGHYTSPHILEFNERIWLNGSNTDTDTLNIAHTKLQAILNQKDIDSLSFFEYTTFLAMLVFNGCDYIVLEAGLGGEHDATAVFPKVLTLVTPIAYDHESFLGNTIEKIARTKLNAIQNNAIIAKQEYSEVMKISRELELEKNIVIEGIDTYLEKTDEEKINEITKDLDLVEYLQNNLKLSIACLKFLGILYQVSDFKDAKLFGRISKLGNNIIVDVGHNPLAAKALVKALKNDKYTLIYNTYGDKEYLEILSILKEIIIDVEIIEINETRIETKEKLQNTLTELEIEYRIFKTIDTEKNYLVFGSFLVVEAFLKVYSE